MEKEIVLKNSKELQEALIKCGLKNIQNRIENSISPSYVPDGISELSAVKLVLSDERKKAIDEGDPEREIPNDFSHLRAVWNHEGDSYETSLSSIFALDARLDEEGRPVPIKAQRGVVAGRYVAHAFPISQPLGQKQFVNSVGKRFDISQTEVKAVAGFSYETPEELQKAPITMKRAFKINKIVK